jgi:hypothetical protein
MSNAHAAGGAPPPLPPNWPAKPGEPRRVLPYTSAADRPLVNRTGIAAAMLHISAVLYLVIAVLVEAFLSELGGAMEMQDGFIHLLAAVCVGLAGGAEVVALGVHRRMKWAWPVAMAVFVIYCGSLFMPLGGIGLWALFAEGTRKEFEAPL